MYKIGVLEFHHRTSKRFLGRNNFFFNMLKKKKKKKKKKTGMRGHGHLNLIMIKITTPD